MLHDASIVYSKRSNSWIFLESRDQKRFQQPTDAASERLSSMASNTHAATREGCWRGGVPRGLDRENKGGLGIVLGVGIYGDMLYVFHVYSKKLGLRTTKAT